MAIRFQHEIALVLNVYFRRMSSVRPAILIKRAINCSQFNSIEFEKIDDGITVI